MTNKTYWYNNLEGGIRSDYTAREIIVAPGKQENKFFVIEQGSARVCLFSDSREQTLGYLKPGSVYVTHSPAWVEAIETTTIISWSLSLVKTLLGSQPEVALSAIREVGSLLNNSINIIENLAFRSVQSRLAHYLLTESVQQNKDSIKLLGNTEILASLLGSTRQTTSTILNKLEKDGLIGRPDREHIILLKRHELEQMAGQ